MTVFREHRFPERATPAGYSAQLESYGLQLPISAPVHDRRTPPDQGGGGLAHPDAPPCLIPRSKYTSPFALKYEGLALAALKLLFLSAGYRAIEATIGEK